MKTITIIEPVKRIEKEKLRVAAYCRVSTDSDKQEESLEAQRSHYEDYIKSNPDWEFSGLYFDEGISGTKTENRKALKKMLGDASEGKIDFILTKSISRFSRNKIDCLNMTRELLGYGVGIYFEKENINTQTMGSEFLLSVMSSLAESESRSISTNEKWGIHVRMQNGSYKQGTPPYGYDMKDGKMIINPEQAEVIRMIFRLYLDGMGTNKIAQKLDAMSITPPKKGKQWHPTTIRGILRNERYIGDCLYMKHYVDEEYHQRKNTGEQAQYYLKNDHDAIISRETFERANAVMAQRRTDRGIHKEDPKYQNRNLFTGKITCAHCGSHLKHVVIKSGNIGSAWACPMHVRDLNSCSLKSIPEAKIRAAFVTMMNKLIFSRRQLMEPYVKELENFDTDRTNKIIAELSAKYSFVLEQQAAITQLAADGVLDPETYQNELNQLNKEKMDLSAKKTTLTMSLTNNYLYTAEAGKLARFLKKASITKNMDEEAFREFVDGVIVYSRTLIGFKLKCVLLLKEELS
ncbi:recombinase family protein [Bilifractor sp. LCP21S3_A7]|uniref:recombinase family protein n=1 Tax=Bilifractor sp. LCP21S3_A7 TaxID=3438738 RepID=UPI003F8EA267